MDAICINQLDLEERNHQVKLMAYIFARAEEVLVWLGLVEEAGFVEKFSPVENEIVNLCSKPYWKRVWIAQEIGGEQIPALVKDERKIRLLTLYKAATKLRVYWALGETGPNRSQPWDKFIDQIRHSPTNVDMPMKLAQQREDRHGDSFLLSNLIEVCQDSLCEEPRDKIYGFVGIAHDCQDDSLPVDYSRALYELYEDVIQHQYHWTKENPDMLKKNKRTMVHFSQVVQKVLGGSAQMSQDYAIAHPERSAIFPPSSVEDVTLNFDPFKLPAINSGTVSISSPLRDSAENFDLFKVTGIFSGTIAIVGPSYSDIIGNPDSSKSWKSMLSNCKTNLPELRRTNEGFMRTLLEVNSRDLVKICSIETEFWWKGDPDPPAGASRVSTQAYLDAFDKSPRFKLRRGKPHATSSAPLCVEKQIVDPRLYLTRLGVMGLMPLESRTGDLIFQFWNSDTVAIVRREEQYMRFVGRGVVANNVYTERSKFQTPLYDNFEFDANGRDLFMDIKTLQLLTQ